MKDKEKIEEIARIIELGCANIECTEKCKYYNEEPYICYSKRCAEKSIIFFTPKIALCFQEKKSKNTKTL